MSHLMGRNCLPWNTAPEPGLPDLGLPDLGGCLGPTERRAVTEASRTDARSAQQSGVRPEGPHREPGPRPRGARLP